MSDVNTPIVPARVTVVDVSMPFSSMVTFMIKWAVAAIPAILILAVLGFFIAAVFAGMGMALAR